MNNHKIIVCLFFSMLLISFLQQLFKHCLSIYSTSSSEDDSLPTGDWITKGCSTILEDNIVTCSCNHLTHFAILLSPGVDKVHFI